MNKQIYENYLNILNTELVPALGCTEPIALAYAAAKARETLGTMPTHVEALCSGNIIKNVKGVKVPNSGGLKGVNAAVILGVLGGNAQKALEVLMDITDEQRQKTAELINTNYCTCTLKEGVPNLFIEITAINGSDRAIVRIEHRHTHITYIQKNDDILFECKKGGEAKGVDKSCLNVRDVITFAQTVDTALVAEVLERQIKYNYAISEEGLQHAWGAQIGNLTLENGYENVKKRAIARAAAGSDARMSGCSLPVIINSGSGNQGMTCSLPVIEFAFETGKSREELYRALIISNLIAQDQKRHIGALSAYCGVVCAAAGSGAAITYLSGGTVEQIEHTIINTVANIGGMMCDGAKPSCAAKIYSALQAAFLGHEMAMKGIVFESGEGLVMDTAEETIKALGYVGNQGMKQTDVEILNIMIGKTNLDNK